MLVWQRQVVVTCFRDDASKSGRNSLFARSTRLNASRDFARVYRKGQSAKSRLFRIAWLPATRTRIAVVTGRKVSTRAVVRNLLKRRVRAIAAALLPSLRPIELIIQLQPNATATTSFDDLKIELTALLVRLQLITIAK